jgi:hypothetical protein
MKTETGNAQALTEQIEAVADRMWRVHPKELQDAGITRKQFYAQEIRALLAAQPSASNDICLNEWLEKTDWVQKKINKFPLTSLGKHRADVMRLEIERLWSAAAQPSTLPDVSARQNGMISLKHCAPPYGEGMRVLVYTEGVDFAGEQFFEIAADDLYEYYEKHEVVAAATHWMPLPYPSKSTSKIAAGQAVQPLPEHDLYVDSDLNKPRSILDSNGQVTLDLCKRCGKGEAELTEPCVRSDSWYGLILKLGCMFDFDAAGSIEEVAVSAAAARDRIFDLRMRLRDAAINKDQSQPAEAPKGFYTFTKPKGWINLADPGQSWEEWTKAQGLPTTRGWFISGETSALSNAGRAKTVAASDDRVFVREVGPFCVNFEYVGAEPAEQSGDKWHEAVLHECMRVESCYVSDDPKQTMLNLINWYHAAWKEEAQSADSRDAETVEHYTGGRFIRYIRTPPGFTITYRENTATIATLAQQAGKEQQS